MSATMPTNLEFVTALFGDDAPWAHVTYFPYDPNAIPEGRHLASWKGDYFSRYSFGKNTNQYFTISNFYSDDQGVARRRKALFRHTPVIVLDDVKEKLSMEEVSKLPLPSWILETSKGSEQWGYILDTPCTTRSRVENLLDGLVANGLAPEGKDPGMKGVTRYVRMPDGVNTKSSKLVDGQPFKCQITLWSPDHKVSIESLALPFEVDLDAVRRESRTDGAAEVSDHPLLDLPDLIHVKEVRSAGRFDITCPWVDEHTGADDSGSAIFTNDDGSMGFKCHHGACQERTGRDLLKLLEGLNPGFGVQFANWKVMRSFQAIVGSEVSFNSPEIAPPPPPPEISFNSPATVPEVSFLAPPATTAPVADSGVDQMIGALGREIPGSAAARNMAQQILKVVDDLPQIDKLHIHNQICDVMTWSKTDFKDIIRDLREQWYAQAKKDSSFYDEVFYIKEQNQFYDWKSRIFFTVEAFQNSFSHEDAEAKKVALTDGRVKKVDKIDYAPKKPRIFIENNLTYGNTYYDDETRGVMGDAARWLGHWDAMGWGSHQEHMLKWMAYTILHPENKINHMLLLGSGEGCGKDFLLYPLIKAMGDNAEVISGEVLIEGFNEYLLSTKYLHINETELGDRKEAIAISNKLKPLATAPPETLRMNPKGTKAINVRNIVNATMTTNSQMPLRLNGMSRRYYAAWSDLNTRDEYDNPTPEWSRYWDDRWDWMKAGGADICIWHLRNCVDISDFNPAAAPPMTEFLREICEASKSTAQQSVEAFVRGRLGAFRSDLVSSSDAAGTLKNGELFASDLIYCDTKIFTPVKVGLLFKEMNGCVKLRAKKGISEVRCWAIRDVEKYKAMSASQLYDEYERQTQIARTAAPLTMVK